MYSRSYPQNLTHQIKNMIFSCIPLMTPLICDNPKLIRERVGVSLLFVGSIPLPNNKNIILRMALKITSKISLFLQGPLFISNRNGENLPIKQLQATFKLDKQYEEERFKISISEEQGQQKWRKEQPIVCNFYFTENQLIELKVEDPYHGTILQNIIHHGTSKYELVLLNKEQTLEFPVWIIWREQVEKNKVDLFMSWKATQLADMGSGLLKSTNASLRFLKDSGNSTFVEAYETEVVKKSQEPIWKDIIIPVGKLFDTSLLLPFCKIQCWHTNGQEKELIGQSRLEYSLFKKQKDGSNDVFVMKSKSSKELMGNLVLEERGLMQPDSFLSISKLGLKLTYTCAFTYTEDSKLPEDKKKALINILTESWEKLRFYIEQFEQKKQFLLFGIGEREQYSVEEMNRISSTQVEVCSELQKQTENTDVGMQERKSSEAIIDPQFFSFGAQPEVADITKLQSLFDDFNPEDDGYENDVFLVPFLTETVERVKNAKNLQSYHVVLIFLTKEFKDFKEAQEFIAKNTNLPVSFLFIGVGLEDHSAMEILNKEGGKYIAGRPMTNYIGIKQFSEASECWSRSLSEIPGQIVDYMGVVDGWDETSQLSKKKSFSLGFF